MNARLLLSVALAFVSAEADAQAAYRITDLGTLGGASTGVSALNAIGQATGNSALSGADQRHAFFWNGSKMIDLGTLGGSQSVGNDINDSGQVTGESDLPGNLQSRAFLWNGTSLVDLGTLGGTRSGGIAINALGQVTGQSYVAGDSVGRAFIWDGTSMFEPAVPSAYQSDGRAINDAGQVAGWFFRGRGADMAAFEWDGAAVVDLGTLGGVETQATDINQAGQVTGSSDTGDEVSCCRHAFLWNGASLIDLGTLGGGVSHGMAINDVGQVTGAAETRPHSTGSHAFLWNGASMLDLGSLGSLNGSDGRDVNNRGLVTGFGDLGGYRAILWDGTELYDLNALVHPTDPLRPYARLQFGHRINDRGQVLVNGIDERDGSGRGYIVSPIPMIGPVDLSDATPVPDGVRDIALVRDEPVRAEIRSGHDGSLIRTLDFLNDTFIPLEAEGMPDTDGNGEAELAVLALRKSDNRGVVEIRDVRGDAPARQIWFAADHMPIRLAVIAGDADDNGVAEIAVLSVRNSDLRGIVEVKNAFGSTNPSTIWVGAGLAPSGLEIVPDADNNGVPEVAILARRNSDGRIVVEVKNAAGTTNPTAVWFMPGNMALDLAVLEDADGNAIPEVAVLSRRDSDGRLVVERKNAAGPTNPSAVWCAGGHSGYGLAAVGDADGDQTPEVAVLSRRDSDGRILVEVKNVVGPTNPRSLWYPPGFRAQGLAVLGDMDENTVDEAAVLLFRESDGRLLVEGRNAAGEQAPKDYWFSP